MYKNQLQELAQRSCFNLPSYSCIREGPDHAPRFKAKVNFNGEIFESPNFFSTLRQAEHASAEIALKTLSQRGPSRALAARVLDETGVYKNLLQETAHRAGLNLPLYTTVRSGPGCAPLFTCSVELAGMSFKGEPAKTKKQAQKSAAMAAWFSLKNLSQQDSSGCSSSDGGKDEQEQVTVARYLSKFKLPERRRPLKAPVKNDVIPYHASRSIDRLQHQNYTYFPLSPDMSTYQNWHHHGMTLPSYLLSSPSAPSSISGPQIFPFVQSIFQSGIGPYIFPREREPVPLIQGGPFFYMAGDLMPACSNNSRVRIEEIEENSQVEEEWRNKDINSSCPRISQSSIASGSQGDVLKYPNEYASMRVRAQTCNREEFSWLSPGFLQNNPGAIAMNQPALHQQNANYSSFSPSRAQGTHAWRSSSPRPTRGPTLVPPETSQRNINAIATARSSASATLGVPRTASFSSRPSRTTVPSYSTRPWLERSLVPCTRTIAPAVQIRSVVPVCSAPAQRVPPAISQGPSSSKGDTRQTKETSVDISAASSEFSRLQI
ncbi:double-stranded RNA-binding protein 2-like [Ipomoea triloba]|uniref:double-stranded RNA-binding protein 2-like n=1 Tax=Ipomoea triloba TaxID=35885 RepID=UPI00125DFC78|nr:double-stranded RNA-binding protein 2-like [Ipomoea triloba]XP_031098566.1 double-stranded RNA-binding protein 2-like [Ipomoea triloba]